MSQSPVSSLTASPQGAPLSMDMRVGCQFTLARHVTVLFKECLAITEQLAEEHDEAMEKLYQALPPQYREYVNLADHFTEEKADRIRRAILQRGNDCKRATAEELEKYDITFRNQS